MDVVIASGGIWYNRPLVISNVFVQLASVLAGTGWYRLRFVGSLVYTLNRGNVS